MIFGVMRVLNLAHGEFVMLGMYAAYGLVVATGINPYLSWIVTEPALALFGVEVYWILIRPVLRRGDENSPIVLTVGLLLILQNLVVFFMTGNVVGLRTDYQFMTFRLAANIIVSFPLRRCRFVRRALRGDRRAAAAASGAVRDLHDARLMMASAWRPLGVLLVLILGTAFIAPVVLTEYQLKVAVQMLAIAYIASAW